MSRQIELARQAVLDLLSEAKSTAIFQRQVKVADTVYLQLITTSGVVSFKVAGVKEPDVKITALTEPHTWKKMSKGRVVLSNEDLAVEPPEKHIAILTAISEEETKRIEAILHTNNVPIAPATALTNKTAAVLTQENQVCLWLTDDVEGASIKALKQVQWTRNTENIAGVYGVLTDKIRRAKANQTNLDAVSVGVLNGHCVISFRDLEHSILITNIVAMPTSFPQSLNYTDRGKYYTADLFENGTFKITEITEEEMKTKLTDPRVLLGQTTAITTPPPAPAPTPAPAPSVEPTEERKFDTADNVTISEAADGTIVTEEVAPTPEPITVEPASAETTPIELPDQPITEDAPKQDEAPEPSFEEQLDQLITFLTDMSQYCKGGIAGVKAMKKRYKEEAKQLRRSAKESEEFIAMKAKLDKAIADKDKAVAQLNKIKSLASVE
jgi:hypothetical protein